MTTNGKSVEYYLGLEYSFNAIADPDGGYVVVFPDLPGCMTQGDTLDEVRHMAEEARILWIEAEYDADPDGIPLPSYPADCSGEVSLRLPKSLHRSLAESAESEGVSLNEYAATLLAQGDARNRREGRESAPGSASERSQAAAV